MSSVNWDNIKAKLQDNWDKCPPSLIYLCLGVIIVLSACFSSEVTWIGLLCVILSVCIIYYFLDCLCGRARWLAWVLIICQLLLVFMAMFKGVKTSAGVVIV